MRMHALLTCHQGQEWPETRAPEPAARGRTAAPRAARRIPLWAVTAAATLALGFGVWLAVPQPTGLRAVAARGDGRSAPRAAVSLIRHSGATGLALPQALPGVLRLAAGSARVRLPTGVELHLFGPLELALENESGMEARLTQGRLLVWVPPRAKGLILRTREWEAWDIGTVFSVTADARGSSLFVFKGQVQVMDSRGDAVGLCEVGEGALGQADEEQVWKMAADWPEAKRLVAPLSGYAAWKTPTDALAAAGTIAELWAERYMPEEAWRIRERLARAAALRTRAKRGAFSQKAWVRPSAPPRSGEEDPMRKTTAAVLAAASLMGAETVSGSSAPIRVDTAVAYNRHWSTLFTNEVELTWHWPAAAVRARLEAVGMNAAAAADLTPETAGYRLRALEGVMPAAEEVIDLTLTFYRGDDSVAETLTARLAIVKAAFGAGAVDTGPDNKNWARVRENAVIPYDAGWAEATDGASASRLEIAKVGGMTQTRDGGEASGYTGWKIRDSGWRYGTFNLLLTFPGTVAEGWSATVFRVPGGTVFSMR